MAEHDDKLEVKVEIFQMFSEVWGLVFETVDDRARLWIKDKKEQREKEENKMKTLLDKLYKG